MGLFDIPDPANYIAEIKDDNLKRAIITTGISLAYSQYITLFYSLGNAIEGKRFIGFLAPVLRTMAASAFKLLLLQDTEKTIYTSVPVELARDTKLLDSIQWEKDVHK